INYFQSLETGDFRHLISFLQQPNSDKLIQFLYQSQLQSISRLNPELNKRGYEGELISYRYPLNKYIFKDTHPEGWGFLHHKIGVAQYKHQEYDNAINSYYCALETLTVEQFPQLRLEVIQDLVKVYLAVRDKDNADDYLLQGLNLLNELLDKVSIEDENQRLRLEAKFLTFRQLTVNVLLEKGEIIEALRNAELEKNRRLTHILEGYQTENKLQETSNIYPSYEQIQTLLTPNQAIVYWFNSPMGLITFIIKQGLQQPIYKLNYSTSQGNSTIEQWIKAWDEDYQDYRSKKDTEIEDKQEHSWRLNLSDRLESLKEILGISEIENDLQDIEELILIPHQDLHRLPLHSLFTQKDLTISYLPSLQIGLKLQQKQQQLNKSQTESLLSIENPRKDLVFSEIESAIINTYFATIETSVTTIEDF
ncbi:Protein prenyltransferase, alpha subunit, partial [Crocosphaera chwakensis CCY0110]